MAESPPPQGASGGRFSGHGPVDLSPALPNFMLPVIESPSPHVESSLPRAPSEPSCQVSTTAGGDAGAQASDETSPTKERGSQRRLFASVDQQIDTSLSNVQSPDQRTAGGEQQAAPTEQRLGGDEAVTEAVVAQDAEAATVESEADMTSAKTVTLRDELTAYGLTEEGVKALFMNEAGVESVEDFKMLCLKEFMFKQRGELEAANAHLSGVQQVCTYMI